MPVACAGQSQGSGNYVVFKKGVGGKGEKQLSKFENGVCQHSDILLTVETYLLAQQEASAVLIFVVPTVELLSPFRLHGFWIVKLPLWQTIKLKVHVAVVIPSMTKEALVLNAESQCFRKLFQFQAHPVEGVAKGNVWRQPWPSFQQNFEKFVS